MEKVRRPKKKEEEVRCTTCYFFQQKQQQAGRQAGRQARKRTAREAGRQPGRQVGRQVDGQVGEQEGRQTKQVDRYLRRQEDRFGWSVDWQVRQIGDNARDAYEKVRIGTRRATNDKRKCFSLLDIFDFDKRGFVRSTDQFLIHVCSPFSDRFGSNRITVAFRREIFQYPS